MRTTEKGEQCFGGACETSNSIFPEHCWFKTQSPVLIHGEKRRLWGRVKSLKGGSALHKKANVTKSALKILQEEVFIGAKVNLNWRVDWWISLCGTRSTREFIMSKEFGATGTFQLVAVGFGARLEFRPRSVLRPGNFSKHEIRCCRKLWRNSPTQPNDLGENREEFSFVAHSSKRKVFYSPFLHVGLSRSQK